MFKTACFFLAALLPQIVSAGIVTSFSTGTEGWDVVRMSPTSSLGHNPSVLSSSALTYVSSGGTPGGYVSADDRDGFSDWFRAPAAYRGDQSSTLGEELSFSLLANLVGTDSVGVVIVGASNTLFGEATAPNIAWTDYSLQLTNSALWRLNSPTGTMATNTQFADVFTDIKALYIKSDWSVADHITGLDSVSLGFAAVPEPNSMIILGALLAPAAFQRRRKA